jgi:iron complex outermembrane receptor protein
VTRSLLTLSQAKSDHRLIRRHSRKKEAMSLVVSAARRPRGRSRHQRLLAIGGALLAGTLAPGEATAQPPSAVASATTALLAVDGSATLVGTVAAPGGIVVNDATVEVTELHREIPVDDTGAFRVENVPPGRYLIQVTSPRWGRAVRRIDVAPDQETRLEVELNLALHHEAVVVTARAESRSLNEQAQPVTVLSGQDLRIRDDATIGETLAQQPGVSSTGYAPGSSRPVIRGLEGARIRVLESGIGSLDVSDTSPDHAVSLDPLGVETAEVVRGPATLLYGSNAVGGVVNVLTDRIPRVKRDRTVNGSLDLFGGSVADYWGGRAALEAGSGPIQVHGDFLKRRTRDYSIPGYAWSEAVREAEEGLHDEDEGVESPLGVLPNSDLDSQGGSVGLSYVGSRGFVGASFTGYDTNFGVPPGLHVHEEEHDHEGEHEGHDHEGEHEEDHGDVRSDLRQRRFDLDSELHEPFAGFRTAKLRFGFADYTHAEVEGDEIGTQFFNDAWEGRVELNHRPWGVARGSFGLQVGRRELEAEGAEAFMPPTKTNAWGLFAFEDLGHGPWKLQLGARYESQKVEAFGDDPGSRDLNGFTASAGTTWRGDSGWGLGLSLTRADRLPTAIELYANGPHIATRTFEVGNPDLDNETSWGFDATFGKREGHVTAEVSGFVNAFDGYIYERFTGEVEDDLLVVEFTQADARFYGLEAEAMVDLVHRGTQHLDLELMADYVRAELTATGSPVPRIPPFGWRAALHYRDVRWNGRLEVRGRAEQTRTAELELPTKGYTLLNASFGYRFFTGRTVYEVMLIGRNLTNAEARNHSSFTKEYVPLPGRDLRLALRVSF